MKPFTSLDDVANFAAEKTAGPFGFYTVIYGEFRAAEFTEVGVQTVQRFDLPTYIS